MKEILTEQFTENTVSLRWMLPLDRETITAWNLLVLMCSARSEKFSTRQAAASAVLHAYGARSGYGLSSYGNRLCVEYRMSWIREDLTDDPHYPEEIRELFDQFLNHPLLNEQSLEEARYLLRNRLQAMSQDPDSRALQEALKAAGRGHDLSVPMQGTLEQLDQVTLDQIRNLHDLLRTSAHETILVGSPDPVFARLIRENYHGQELEASWSALPAQECVQTVLEKDISQSSLVQIYSSGILPQSDLYYPLLVLNALLGGGSVSLLFEEVREKHSYCYSISSFLIRFDGALVISVGADCSTLDDVRRLIREVIDRVVRKDYPPQIFRMIQMELCDGLAGQKDSPLSMMEQTFLNELLQRPMTVSQMKERILDVTPDQVSQAAACLQLTGEASVVQKGVVMDEAAAEEI